MACGGKDLGLKRSKSTGASLPASSLRSIRCLYLNAAHIFGEVTVAEHLSDCLDLSRMVPIVIRDAPQRRSHALSDCLALQ